MNASLSDFSPIRYTGDRHFYNNGFRQVWLANGARHAAVINAARAGDFDAVLSHVRAMGGVRGGVGIARSIIKMAQKLTGDVPAYRIERDVAGRMMVYTPLVSWRWAGNHQVGHIQWRPMFGNEGFQN